MRHWQAQQLAWHKHDFPNMAIVLLALLGWAASVVVRALMGTFHPSMLVTVVCSAYIALATYTLCR